VSLSNQNTTAEVRATVRQHPSDVSAQRINRSTWVSKTKDHGIVSILWVTNGTASASTYTESEKRYEAQRDRYDGLSDQISLVPSLTV